MSEEAELRYCSKDGPFRGLRCPVCGEDGKRLMFPDEVWSIGRILAGMLRHFPENYGIRLDSHGYARIYSIVPAIKSQKRRYGWLTPLHIESLGKTDEKGRYQVSDRGEIRATYDHTIPVDLSDLPVDEIPDVVYYQTTPEEYDLIRETGINPSDKTYIHLSSTFRKAYVSGRFHVENPLIIGISTERMRDMEKPVYRASREVFLTLEIPPECIEEIDQEPVTLTEEEIHEIESVRRRRERKLLGDRMD